MNSNLNPVMAVCLKPFLTKFDPEPVYKFRGFIVRSSMLADIHAYEERGEPVGHFLTAVLENNLKEAVGRADDENLSNLPAYVGYLYNEADSRCWGSPEKVREWYRVKAMKRTQGEAS